MITFFRLIELGAHAGDPGKTMAAKLPKVGRRDSRRRKAMANKAAENHRKAAEHHEHAARHHKEAAKLHEEGKHETAAHHAHLARGHQERAAHYAAEAAEDYIILYAPLE